MGHIWTPCYTVKKPTKKILGQKPQNHKPSVRKLPRIFALLDEMPPPLKKKTKNMPSKPICPPQELLVTEERLGLACRTSLEYKLFWLTKSVPYKRVATARFEELWLRALRYVFTTKY